MAEAGFYWCGTALESDTASCFLCGKVLDGWESTDDPWSEHKKHSPQCAFVKLGRKEDELTVSYIYTTSMFIRVATHNKGNNRLLSRYIQVGEQLDLMDSYVQKQFDQKLEKARKALSQLGTKARTQIQIT